MADDSDEDQAVKMLNPIRHADEEVDPAFEAELASLTGPATAASALHAASSRTQDPGPAAASDENNGQVAFKLVMHKGGSAQVQVSHCHSQCL